MKGGAWARIRSSVNSHRILYYGLAGLAVLLVVLQSGLGITIAVLTGIQGERARTAVIILGAINSFVGALAGTLQYWGQPTREARYFNALKEVKFDVERLLGEFKDPAADMDPYKKGNEVMEKYTQAMRDAWSNTPMIWVQNTKPPQQP